MPESLDEYVARVVAQIPPLSDWQRERLRHLLNGRTPVYDDPAEELRFREDQAGWRRRITAARRSEPLDDGTTDPDAPGGRWSA